MQTIDGRPVYAATDLVAFLACDHLIQLERASLAQLVQRPMRDDPELDIIRRRGFQHEARFFQVAQRVVDGRVTDARQAPLGGFEMVVSPDGFAGLPERERHQSDGDAAQE